MSKNKFLYITLKVYSTSNFDFISKIFIKLENIINVKFFQISLHKLQLNLIVFVTKLIKTLRNLSITVNKLSFRIFSNNQILLRCKIKKNRI